MGAFSDAWGIFIEDINRNPSELEKWAKCSEQFKAFKEMIEKWLPPKEASSKKNARSYLIKQKIKGFWKDNWKAITKFVCTAAKLISLVLPPNVGFVVRMIAVTAEGILSGFEDGKFDFGKAAKNTFTNLIKEVIPALKELGIDVNEHLTTLFSDFIHINPELMSKVVELGIDCLMKGKITDIETVISLGGNIALDKIAPIVGGISERFVLSKSQICNGIESCLKLTNGKINAKAFVKDLLQSLKQC